MKPGWAVLPGPQEARHAASTFSSRRKSCLRGVVGPGLRVARILGAAIGDDGFALGGGYALQAHGIVDRPSKDLDSYAAAMDVDMFARFAAAADELSPPRSDAGSTDVGADRNRHRADRRCAPEPGLSR